MAYNTLYDYYQSQGKTLPTYNSPERLALASQAGITSGYVGSAAQNQQITNYLNTQSPAPSASTTLPGTITGASVTPQPQITPVTPGIIPVPNVTKLDTTVPAPLTATPEETKAQAEVDRLRVLNEQAMGQSAYRATQETAQGIPELQKTQTDLSAQLKAIQNEALAIPQQLQLEATGRGISDVGLQPVQTAALRNNAIKALSISSLLEASKGNLATANDNIARAIAARFDPIQEEINARTKNLELIINSPNFKLSERNRAQAQLDIQNQKKADLEKQKKNQEDIYQIALSAAKNGANSLILQKIQAAKTPIEAVQIASNSLEEQTPVKVDLLTLEERKRTYPTLPLSLVGKPEQQVLSDLESATIPQWYKDMRLSRIWKMSPNITQAQWDEFRNNILVTMRTQHTASVSQGSEVDFNSL